MSEIFLKIVNMSISASYVVLAVLLLRILLKKAPRWITVALWGIVALRLICPFSLESVISLIPSAETVSPDIMLDRTPAINTGVQIVNDIVNPVIGTVFAPDPATSANPLQLWIPTFALFWMIGMLALVAYTVISYARLRRKIGTAVLLRDNIYQSERVVSPFVLGIIKPKIYLPFDMDEKDMTHVIAHEQAHIRRKDHLWKPIGFLILTVHWFNPLVWLGYVLLCRDIELACDEKVIRELDRDARADYSQALLSCSINRRMIAACPLAFGEVGVKDRVRSVLCYKKPAFWIIIVAVIACVAVAVCFLTDPPTDNRNNLDTASINTEYEGVYISLESFDRNEGGAYVFNVLWHNTTGTEVTYGMPFSIQYYDGREWVSTATKELVFTTQGFLLKPHTTKAMQYTSDYFDLSKSGSYRLLVPFSVKEGSEYKSYRTWVEFYIDDIGNIRVLSQRITLIYDCPIMSYTMDPSEVPVVTIEKDKIYQTVDGRRELLGSVRKISINKSNFDSFINIAPGFDYSELAKSLRENNKTAYEVIPRSVKDGIELFYIMEQKNGEILIVYGHYKNGEKEDFIRFIYSVVP
jgi:beta-lactamase regulating signal transducer with metallopeptidase domain